MVWRATDPPGNESGKIMFELPQYTRGRGLDLGCGPDKAWPHFIGVDDYTATAQFGIGMKPDIACNVTKLDVFGSASMDFAYSSHCLEHVKDYKATLKEWWRVIKPGGYLCLYLPHKEFYPNIGQPGANPDHKHDFMPARHH
jgi:predicted SAM-dependent methyltransferase